MVWVYEDPPFTQQELRAYKDLKRKLKDKEFVDKLIKIISLYIYLKRKGYKTTKEIKEAAYYDKSKKLPIFNEKTAKKLLKALKQKGGRDTKYPFTDVAVKGILRDFTPDIIGNPVSSVYGLVTGTVETLKNSIPFADLALEAVHAGTELGVTTANDVGEVVGGPIGAVAVAPFTAVATGFSSALSAGEGDLGGVIAHVANWIPGLGIILNKAMVQGEHMAKVMKNHPNLAEFVPYMTEYHQTLESENADDKVPSTDTATAGKRLSTMKHKSRKWQMKTQRKKSATL
jgi:hypothetical protein